MPPSTDTQVKKQIIKQWLSGNTRDKIAADNHVGGGTVTNIVNEYRKRLDDSEFDAMRDLTVSLKKEGISLSELASRARLYNFIKKLGAKQDEIESFFGNLLDGANSLQPEKTVELINQLYDIAKSESIAPTEVPAYVKQKMEEKHRLEAAIQKAGATLQSKNVNILTINQYRKLEEELRRNDLTMNSLFS